MMMLVVPRGDLSDHLSDHLSVYQGFLLDKQSYSEDQRR